MTSHVIKVTNGLTLKSITDNEPTIIIFTRPNCASSKKMIYTLNEFAKRNPHIACVNIDMNPECKTGWSLALRFNILVVPSFIVFAQKKEINRGCGYINLNNFISDGIPNV